MTRRRGACQDLAEEPRRQLLAEVARDYTAGATLQQLAEGHRRGIGAIRALLSEAGVRMRPRRPAISGKARRELARQLRRRYEADTTLTVAALAESVPYSTAVVRQMLLQAGTTIRRHRLSYRRRGACTDLPSESRRALLDAVARDYAAGATIAALARRHSRGRNTIKALLREASVPLRQTRTPTITGHARQELSQALRRRYEDDTTLTVAALAETVPYSYEVVRALLHEAGTPITTHERPHRHSPRGPCPHLRGEPRQALLAELARDYTAGAPLTALATAHHHSRDTVKTLLQETGVPLRPAPAPRGQARRKLSRQLRRRYDTDTTLTVTDLAETLPYSTATVRRLLLDAGTTLRPSTASHHDRAQRHGMTDTEFHTLGLAVRHLYLTKIAGSGPLARFTGHPAVAIRSALSATGLSTRITYAPAPDRAFPHEEALALGALLWDRYRNGTTIPELATPLGPRAIPAITHALATYATTHPEHTTPDSDPPPTP